jgi:myo-inositol-1-phosphate synthase
MDTLALKPTKCHPLLIQSMKLRNTLRWMVGEELITHLGAEYYD